MGKRIAVFASGFGSNVEKICGYFDSSPDISAVLILSNNPNAFVLQRAKRLNVDTFIFDKLMLKNYVDIALVLEKYKIDFIVLAGFLLKIPNRMIKDYPQKIINLHPSLLPKYGGKGMFGKRVHNAVLENKEGVSGITIHFVNEEYDKGEVIFQAKCKVEKTTSLESLMHKIRELEHRYFPKVISSVINSETK